MRERARAHARFRRRLALATAAEAARMWRRVEPARIQDSWLGSLARLLVLLTGAQQTVAAQADTYLDEVLDAQDLDPGREGTVAAAALAGVASDGRDLTSLLYQPVVTALTGIQRGATVDRALASGQATLGMIVRTQVADAGRTADQVAMTARPAVRGWVRMLTLPSCARCIILAGRRYTWDADFPRHPACYCSAIPAAEDTADDLRTDPRQAFESMDPAEQDRVFTKAGAQAIRDGADLSQVVNARRGISTATQVKVLRGGRQETTTTGTTRRGLAGRRLGGRQRLMPGAIYEQAAGDRDEALRLLKLHGYIL